MLNRWEEQLRKHGGLAAALLSLISVGVFQGVLRGQFVFDDIPQILENPFVVNAHFWRRIFEGSVWSFRGAGEHDNMYRPLQFAVYWLLYRVGGANPLVFHLLDLLWYGATVWMVYRVGRELLGSRVAAWVGALLWGLHPLHVEAVAWVSALPDVGAAWFCLWGFWLFLRAEKAEGGGVKGHVWAAVVYLPALFFKEAALSFPLLLVGYWYFLGGKGGWGKRGVSALPYLGAVGAYVAARIAVLGSFSQAPYVWKLTWRTVGMTVGLLGQHAKLFFWPAHLTGFRVFDFDASLRSPWPWLALLALAGALGLRKRLPLLGFLMVWWVVMLLPTMDFRQVGFPVADRFSYLPSVGLCLAIAYVGLLWLPPRLPRLEAGRTVIPVLGVVALLWAIQDVRVIPNWRDNAALWTYSVHASPNSALVHLLEGTLLQYREGDFDGAVREFETALRLNDTSVRPLAGITYECYLALGKIALMRGRTSEAINYYENAVRLAPNHSPAYKSLGAAYFPRGDYQKAAEYFTIAVRLNPQDVESRFFLGTCALKLGEPRQAAAQFRAARIVEPNYSEAYEAEARALEAMGDSAGAAQVRSLARGEQRR